MNPARPSNVPPGSSQAHIQRPMDPARAAAQRAFFEAALGRAPAAAAPQAAAAPSAPKPLQRTPEAGAPKPEKLLRPGSLLDIRV
ncbi:hypothetical protein [Phenylobacterium sp.]|uniref:hypothetical protein n=1 Tax=Phenylobacterium sp. TaxID=1871053 RepID=UPI002F91F653